MKRALGLVCALSIAGAMPALGQTNANQTNANPILTTKIGIDERLDGPSVIGLAFERAGVTAAAVPVLVRLAVDWPTLQAGVGGDWRRLDERLAEYSRLSLPVMILIRPGPLAQERSNEWTDVIRALADHGQGRLAGYQIDERLDETRPDPRLYAFFLKLAAVQIRSTDPKALVAQIGVRESDLAWETALYAEGVAPYVDVVATVAAGPALTALVKANDPTAVTCLVGVPLGDTSDRSPDRLLTTVLSLIGESGGILTTFTGGVDAWTTALGAANQLKDVLADDVAALDDANASLAISAGGVNVTARVPHRLLFNMSTGGTYLAYWNADAIGDPITITLITQDGRAPVLRDAISREARPVQASSWDPQSKLSRLTSRTSPHPLVLDFNYEAPGQFVSRVDVHGNASLTVDEIIARNRQAEAAQARAFQTIIASLRIQLHFRPTATQVFDVVTDNRVFAGRGSVEWEELSFSVNGTKWGPDHPGVPLLQAEKVLTLPLALRLTTDYRYRLEGVETVGERRCYVVAFNPIGATQTRYSGRVWIDETTWLRLKVQTVQTHLRGEIVSSEEITQYEPVATIKNRPIYLPARVSTKQTLLLAGRTLLLEKEQWFSGFRLDADDFDRERQVARDSRHVMFRDTEQGVRHLVQQGSERVVSTEMRHSTKALAMGTIIDPTFDFPLPIFGINYLNFNFMGHDNQFALLFGGVFALGSMQVPKIGKTPLDGSIDFFGIAVPGTDLHFDQNGERRDERVLNIPASINANLGWQFTSFQKVTVGYEFRYDAYFNAPDTAIDFVKPANTATHGVRVGYQYSRHGYQFGAAASASARTTWSAWGRPGDFQPDARTYRRQEIGVSKDFLVGPFQTFHVGAEWYDGARLDRFSMYQFGLFDAVRMHGVPAAGIRFPAVALARGSYSFNVFNVYRLDLFLEQAFGRDPIDRALWRPITGTGVAVTFKTPHNTMFIADIGKSFLPALYRKAGSVVLQFTLLKPL